MRSALCVVGLLWIAGCASTPHREEPDPAALERAVDAAAAGKAEQAEELADAAVAACGPGRDGFACGLASRVVLANRIAALGDYPLALSQARSAVSLADEYGDAFAQAPPLLVLAGAAARADELAEAESAIARAERLISDIERIAGADEKASLDVVRAMLDGPRALIRLKQDKPAEAAKLQSRLVEAVQTHDPNHPNLPIELLNLADMYQVAGDLENAADALRRGATVAARVGNLKVEQEALLALESLAGTEGE